MEEGGERKVERGEVVVGRAEQKRKIKEWNINRFASVYNALGPRVKICKAFGLL